MATSGYCADNPSAQSNNNCVLIHNPLLRPVGRCCGSPDIHDTVNREWDKELEIWRKTPPSKKIGSISAVPVSFGFIDAEFLFDAQTKKASAVAIVEIRMGAEAGYPIFDLRQKIIKADIGPTANGPYTAIALSKIQRHDFGGGKDAEMLVLKIRQKAEEPFFLRLEYNLALPNAPTDGADPPELSWSESSSGRKLNFGFGFTDLRPGRYLESWLPANLIYDSFQLKLTVQIKNTPISHEIITNNVLGGVKTNGNNHWEIVYANSRYQRKETGAFDSMLEIRPSSDLTFHQETFTLPVSKRKIWIKVWMRKDLTEAVNLVQMAAYARKYLTTNEKLWGPYPHYDKFVVLFDKGGMEYAGGATCAPAIDVLAHEIFHNWWGRHLKPLTQADGWIDEGWAGYHDGGGTGSTKFDFVKNPPVQLCNRNPWSRVTPGGAQFDGAAFFKGLAHITGSTKLNAIMREFYTQNQGESVTTEDLEAFSPESHQESRDCGCLSPVRIRIRRPFSGSGSAFQPKLPVWIRASIESRGFFANREPGHYTSVGFRGFVGQESG